MKDIKNCGGCLGFIQVTKQMVQVGGTYWKYV